MAAEHRIQLCWVFSTFPQLHFEIEREALQLVLGRSVCRTACKRRCFRASFRLAALAVAHAVTGLNASPRPWHSSQRGDCDTAVRNASTWGPWQGCLMFLTLCCSLGRSPARTPVSLVVFCGSCVAMIIPPLKAIGPSGLACAAPMIHALSPTCLMALMGQLSAWPQFSTISLVHPNSRCSSFYVSSVLICSGKALSGLALFQACS